MSATDLLGEMGPCQSGPPKGGSLRAGARGVSWVDVLDEMDRRLALVHQALEEHRGAPRFPPLPRATAPIPDALVERARSALARTEACEDAVQRRLVTVSATLYAVRARSTRRGADRQAPAFVDTNA